MHEGKAQASEQKPATGEASEATRDQSSQDLKKRREESALGDTVRRGTAATSDLVGGLAGAIAQGFSAYRDQITSDNALKVGLDNGFIEGTVAGYASFFDEMAATARRVLKDLRESRQHHPAAPVDYDKLARLVAVEMVRLQQPAHIETTFPAPPGKTESRRQ